MPDRDTNDSETEEILSDDQAMEQLRKSIEDVKEGRVIPWEEAESRRRRKRDSG